MKRELKIFSALAAIFITAYVLPLGNPKIQAAIQEAFRLLQWYARNHTLACVVPALFIAGAIITFLSKESVLRYPGPRANKPLAYAVASVSGCVLAVCSCSVLPMFAGIYGLGAGLGPATAFLYSGPGINVLAIFLSARVLGFDIGAGRFVGDNSLRSNLVASVIGAFWYFATLTEIPITQALMKLGMSKGPVLALLLAGPALSLPSILVIRKVMGNAKTIVFIVLVVIMSTIVGMLFGAIWG